MPTGCAVLPEYRLGAQADNDSGQHLPPKLGLQPSDSLPIVSLLDEDRPSAAISCRRSSVVSSSSTALANDSGSSAIRTFFPCSRPSPAHPEEVETMARLQASDSSTFRFVPAEICVGTTTTLADA